MQRPQLPGVAVRSRWVAIVALVGVATLVLAAGASSRTRSKDPVSAKGAKISMVLVLDDCVIAPTLTLPETLLTPNSTSARPCFSIPSDSCNASRSARLPTPARR